MRADLWDTYTEQSVSRCSDSSAHALSESVENSSGETAGEPESIQMSSSRKLRLCDRAGEFPMRIWTMATIGALALCAATATAQATSIGGGASAFRVTAAAAGVAEKVAYRRCWWRNGVRHCRRYRSAYAPYYGVYGQQYSTGSPIGIIMGIR